MLIDSHCHLPHKNYALSTKQVVEEAVKAGVSHMVAIGTSVKENATTLKEIQSYDNVYASIGIYPHEDQKISPQDLYTSLEKAYSGNEDKVIAVGECGIDISNWQNGRSLEEQKELFKLQIGFAVEKDLPLIIHNRNGDECVLAILTKYRGTSLHGVAHCFSSTWETAKKLLDLNFYISFAGNVTYKSAAAGMLETVANVPTDRYLVETDAPYLPPQGHRGEINYPKYVKITAEKIAEIRKISFKQVSQETFSNTARLFKLNI